jgi:two-component system, cell cycle sensor histidine kinase and response regulator CckA
MTDNENSSGETPYEIAYLRVLVDDLENKNRQSEELLRILTEQYRRITEVVSDYIFSVHVIDGNPVETIHGSGCLTITGYSPEEFVSNTFLWINMVFEDDRVFVLRHVAGILSGKDIAPFEHRIVRKDGVVRWVRNMPVCQYDSAGKLIAYDGLIRDITELRHAEEALAKSEEKYRMIADFTYDWEEWMGSDREFVYVSPACQRITGYSREEFIENPDLVMAMAHPADRLLVEYHYSNIEHSDAGPQTFDFRIITKSGKVSWINHSCQPVFGEDGRWLGRRASNRDVNRRKGLMDELLKARQLEAVAILAGGVAHDFSNLVSVILGNISLCKVGVDLDSRQYALLSSAEDAASRTRELTRQLVDFSKRGEPQKTEFAVSDMLRKIAMSERSGNGIDYEFIIPDALWKIRADEGQISHAIQNLIINAREAIDNNGIVAISSDNVVVADSSGIALEPGDYVSISVQDTGIGIPADNINRLFDPYFTTKDKSSLRGIGLGLAMAHSIIANHLGIITVESEPGTGTTMTVYLPAIR